MKAILVIDMPTDCIKCPLADGYCWNTFPTKGRADGCPLKDLPQKIEGKREKFMPTYSLGWNDCLDAIELGLKPLWEITE